MEDDQPTMAPAMALALQASFGSFERWRKAFIASGLAPGGGGWARLCYLPDEGRLVNQGAAAPLLQAAAGGIPVLALPGLAAQADAGSASGASADALIDRIDWAEVYQRYQQAVQSTTDALAASPADLQGARLLDVRRAAVFEQADAMIPGATWCNPQSVDEWAAALPKDQPVVVYCVYGHEVGRSTAMRLHAAGIPARFLRGGIDGWAAAGLPLQAKGEGP